MTKLLPLALLTLSAIAGAAQAKPLSTRAERGLAFAEARCSGCHAVEANGTSSNPESPPFEDVANRSGVTERTLRRFLADSHNFPVAMKFKVNRRHIRDLAAYVVTLQREDYTPSQ